MRNSAYGSSLYRGRSALSVLAWAAGIGILVSTEFLTQPFVWRGWPISAVLEGWLHVAFDRLLIACSIALCMIAASQFNQRDRKTQLFLMILAVLSGSVLGESLRTFIEPLPDPIDAAVIAIRVTHWTLVGLAAVGIMACWQLNAEYASTAAEDAAADSRARRMLVASELDALQRQIEPHFLFNTLATIKRFGHTAPHEGHALLERLFDYISKTFSMSQQAVSDLGAELDLVGAYLDVCRVRMGSRLTVIEDISPTLRTCRFPPLMLGTLVENALRHGLAPLEAGGTIALSAARVDSALEVLVRDNGVGLTGESGCGIGLANLSARLRLLYGDEASLRLEAIEPQGVCARLRIPYVLAA